MIILYVPFELDDAFGDLVSKADRWRDNYLNKDKETIIVYHNGLTTANQKLIADKLESGGVKIYILSHGVDGSEHSVVNQEDDDEFVKSLTIEQVAEHFKQDLMFGQFSNKNTVKLYFCDVHAKDEKAKKMAEAFRGNLGKSFQSLEVQYYTDVSISAPVTSANQEKGFASGKNASRIIQIQHPLLCFELSYLIGRAKEQRHGLSDKKPPVKTPFFSSSKARFTIPEFSHPLLQKFAESIISFIQEDKLLSKKQDEVIKELFAILPTDLKEYAVDSVTLRNTNLKITLKINKSLLKEFLKQDHLAPEEKASSAQKDKTDTVKSGWVDSEDLLEEEHFSFSRPTELLDFKNLEDYSELFSTKTGDLKNSLT